MFIFIMLFNLRIHANIITFPSFANAEDFDLILIIANRGISIEVTPPNLILVSIYYGPIDRTDLNCSYLLYQLLTSFKVWWKALGGL